MGGIELVDPRYIDLWERTEAVLTRDSRVLRLEVGGSIGDGTADRWSDLDVLVYVKPDDLEPMLAEWPQWLAEITPTVFARTPLAPFIINTITADGLTFDIAVIRDDAPPMYVPKGFGVGLLSRYRFDEQAGAVEYAVAETLRGLAGPFVSYLERGEHVRHMTGCAHILGLLTAVMLAETGSAPVNGKHLNASLNDEQLVTLEQLPPLRATRVDVAAFGLAVAAETLRRARPLFVAYDLEWPDALEAVARRRVAEIGFTF